MNGSVMYLWGPAVVWNLALLWFCRYLWRREMRINPPFNLRYSIADLCVMIFGIGLTFALFAGQLQSDKHVRDNTLAMLLILIPHQIATCFAFRLESVWPGVTKASPRRSALMVVAGLFVGAILAPLVTGAMLGLGFVLLCLLPILLPFAVIVHVFFAMGRNSDQNLTAPDTTEKRAEKTPETGA